MHHRGGGIGHTTGHSSLKANNVPPNLYGKLGLQVADDLVDDTHDRCSHEVESLVDQDGEDYENPERVEEELYGLNEESGSESGESDGEEFPGLIDS